MKKIIPYLKFFTALLIFFFGSYLQYIPVFLFHLDTQNMKPITAIFLNTFSNLICFLILVIMYRKDILKGFKDLKEKHAKPLGEGFNIWFIGLMIMVFSNVVISWFNQGNTSTNEESIRLLLSSFPLLMSLSVAIISPCIEELVFRKSFREIFKNKWVYLCTSGIIFGALHVILSPINSFVDYLYLIPYCSMGFAFSYMYYKTDNIMVPITLHIAHNTLNVISTLLLAGVIIW